VRRRAEFLLQGARPLQEDRALADDQRGIWVVADGFGGGSVGAEAADLACKSVHEFLARSAGDREATLPFVLRSCFSLVGNLLFNSLVHANQRVFQAGKGRLSGERGGASVVAAYLDGDFLALAQVGGCSAWLVREGRSVELVTPRTYGRLVDPLEPGPGLAPLAALGISESLEPELIELRLRAGDWLVLATDGVPSAFRGELQAFQRMLLDSETTLEHLESLIGDRLREGGGGDNAAQICVFF
jgi:protein phosphatase